MKSLSHKFSVFKSRHCLLHAYWKYSQKKLDQARKLGNKAVKQAYGYGCKFDEEWAEACMLAWFGNKTKTTVTGTDALDETDMYILR